MPLAQVENNKAVILLNLRIVLAPAINLVFLPVFPIGIITQVAIIPMMTLNSLILGSIIG